MPISTPPLPPVIATIWHTKWKQIEDIVRVNLWMGVYKPGTILPFDCWVQLMTFLLNSIFKYLSMDLELPDWVSPSVWNKCRIVCPWRYDSYIFVWFIVVVLLQSHVYWSSSWWLSWSSSQSLHCILYSSVSYSASPNKTQVVHIQTCLRLLEIIHNIFIMNHIILRFCWGLSYVYPIKQCLYSLFQYLRYFWSAC